MISKRFCYLPKETSERHRESIHLVNQENCIEGYYSYANH